MTLRRVFRRLALLLVLVGIPAQGEGPLYVGGAPAVADSAVLGTPVPGLPFHWPIDAVTHTASVTYWTDQGMLGTLSKAQADQLVATAFGAWAGAPTANITFSKAGDLSTDIQTGAQLKSLENDLANCSVALPPGSLAKDRSIVYDKDGGILTDLGDDPNTILGFADAICLEGDGITNFFNRGFALLNGKGVTSSSDAELQAVMTHEFGHMIGLDHSQINLDCLTGTCSSAELNGVPIMFPVLLSTQTNLRTDDIAGVSTLYPGASFSSSRGRITGRVLFTDGVTPAQGFNVIARLVSDPQTTAVSNVSGYLFTADAGNPLVQWPGLTPSPYGSRDQTLIGYYDLPGLPPGDYTVEVEAIHNSEPIPFVYDSGLGPIGDLGFQFPLPSLLPPPCTPEYLVSGTTATCISADATTILVTAGSTVSTGTDVTLIGTPPRYDAWEAGP
jgi:hypothetical protein